MAIFETVTSPVLVTVNVYVMSEPVVNSAGSAASFVIAREALPVPVADASTAEDVTSPSASVPPVALALKATFPLFASSRES